MLLGYLDESNTHADAPHVVVGGFVGGIREWGALQGSWRAELERVGVPWFHCVDCRGRNKEYHRFTRDDSERHLERLAAIVGNTNLQHFAAVYRGNWKSLMADHQKLERRYQHPYQVCLELVVEDILECIRINWPGERLALVLSQQDQFTPEAQRVFRLFKHNGLWPEIASLTVADPRDVIPLQVADMLAYEVHRGLGNWQGSNRPELQMLSRVLCEPGYYGPRMAGKTLSDAALREIWRGPIAILTPPPGEA